MAGVKITIDSQANLSGLQAASQELTKLMGLGNLVEEFGRKLAGAFAIGTFIELTREAIQTEEELGKMSQKIGIAVESLSTLVYAAKASHLEVGQFQIGLKFLNDHMVNAAQHAEASVRAFKELGVGFQNTDGTMRQTDAVLLDIADRFKAMPDGAQKTALAVQLFGRAGIELIPMLNRGRDGIEEFRAEAKKLGLQITAENVRAVEEFIKKLVEFRGATQGLFIGLANNLLPALTAIASSMTKVHESAGGLQVLFSALAKITEGWAKIVIVLSAGFQELGMWSGYVNRAMFEGLKGNTKDEMLILKDAWEQHKRIAQSVQDQLAELASPTPRAAPRKDQTPPVDSLLQQKLAEATLQGEVKNKEALIKGQEQALQAAYEANRISFDQYFDRRREIVVRRFALEKEALEKQIGLTPGDDVVQKRKLSDALEVLSTDAMNEMGRIEAERKQAGQKAQEERAQELLKVTEADIKAQEAALQVEFDGDKSGYEEYYNKREELIRAKFAAERAVIEAELAKAVTPEQQAKFKAQLQVLKSDLDAEISKNAGARDTAAVKDAQEAVRLAQERVQVTLAQVKLQERLVETNPFLPQAEQAKILLPLLERENELIKEQIAALEEQAKNPDLKDEKRLEVEKQILELKAKEADIDINKQKLASLDFHGEIMRVRQSMINEWGNLAVDFARITTGTITNAVHGLSQALTEVVMWTKSAAAAFSQFGISLLTNFISSIIEMILWAEVAIPILTWLGIVSGGSTIGPGLAMTTMAAGMSAGIAASATGHAGGGLISGPGTGTSDSVLSRLSAGEFVMRAAAVNYYGPELMARLNAMTVPTPSFAGFAAGGLVPDITLQSAGSNVNVAPAPVHVYFVDDARRLKELLASHEGQKVLVNGIMRAKTDLGILS